MANNGEKIDDKNKEVPQGTNEEPKTEVICVKQKNGIGTAIKIGGSLLLMAVGTGLGWFLKGVFGGKDDGNTPAAEEETPKE